MKHVRFALFVCLLLPGMAWSQINLVPIQEIQGWAGIFQPDSCNAGPNPVYLNDTVKIKGIVMVNGGVAITSSGARWIWVRDVTASPSTPYGHITIRNPGATSPFDLNDAKAGDTIEVVGIVQEFHGAGTPAPNNEETQFAPIPSGVTLLSEEPGPEPLPYLLTNLGELNGPLNVNGQPANHITTGEKYEGNFLEIHDVTVDLVDYQQANDRCRIRVKDANNNQIWIYDRFKTQRPSNGFIPPNVGDTYTSIKGLIESWQNGCPTSAATNRGYNLNPFSLEHYVKGASSPSIGNIVRNPVCPTSTQAVTASATITDDGTVFSADILYSTDGTTYTAIPATAIGNVWSAQIPAKANGTLVRYYVRARDDIQNTTLQPNVPAGSTPAFYTVNDAGCTIRDVQFTPYITGRSGYELQTVTVRGVVTGSAEASNLGFVYIQQEGQTSWGGIWVNGGALISSLHIGDLVDITGVVEEYFGLTRISGITNVQTISTGQTVTPLELAAGVFSTYNFAVNEQYESMLVKLINPTAGQPLFVVDTNADAANGQNNAEYRIGPDVLDPNSGCRILAGRQTGSSFSSLNVSYVNAAKWATVDGTMNVPVILFNPGDVVPNVQGILTYSFSNMKLLPRNNTDITINSTVGVKGLLSNRDFTLYPNPSSGAFNLNFSLPVQNASVEIYSTQGQLVHKSVANGTDVKIDSKTMHTGLYLVRIKNEAGQLLAVRSLAIQK